MSTADEVADFIQREWGPVPMCPEPMMTRIWDRIIASAADKFGKDAAVAGEKRWLERKRPF